MNIFKKFYCRTYQLILRLAMPFLPYREPVLIKDYQQMAEIINSMNLKNILLVTDKTLKNLGLTGELEDVLKNNEINVFIYDETVPNPTSNNVKDGLKIYKDNLCQAIIAFGGGSPMDCAKAIGACVIRPKKSLMDMKGVLKVRKKIPTLFAIPTTAGTGSETTIVSVITDSETRYKYAINDFCLIPSYALLDAKLTLKLPPKVTATTGMDALTHAIEAYIGRSTTKKTRKYAIDAIKIIFDNIILVYNNGENLEARQNMLRASYFAGIAFTQSYVGYVHAIAHSLGGKYNIAHGEANAILLPYVLKMYGKNIYKKLKKICVKIGLCNKNCDKKLASEMFIKKIEDLNLEMNIGNKITLIESKDIPNLAKTAEKEANPLYPVPVLFTAKELEKIYREASNEWTKHIRQNRKTKEISRCF